MTNSSMPPRQSHHYPKKTFNFQPDKDELWKNCIGNILVLDADDEKIPLKERWSQTNKPIPVRVVITVIKIRILQDDLIAVIIRVF